MKTRPVATLVVICLIISIVPLARGITHVGVKICLTPQDGFGTYLAAAFAKHLAVTIVSDPEKADYSWKQLRWIASRKARAAKSRAACSPTALEFKARNRPACV